MADISTGRQRGIVPFVNENTGRLPDQYLPQGVIDLQGDLEQAVSNAAASATAAQNAVDGFGLEVGTTTTGEPGSDAAVEIQKNGAKYTASFTIPQGAQGPRGERGLQGPQGVPGENTSAISSVTASVDNTSGTPNVSVTTGGTPTDRTLDFRFTGLKGDGNVSHDDTLTGNGTSGSPLGVNKFTILDDNVDFNTVKTFGIFLKAWARSATNTPIVGSQTQYLLLVNSTGRLDSSDVTQVIVPMSGINGADKIYFRYYAQPTNWSEWKQLITSNDLSNYVPLSTYRALETRVQALEAKLASQ